MMTEKDMIIADTLSNFINMTDDCDVKYKLAEVRNELVCEHSKLGSYQCSIKLPFSSNVPFCDFCLEEELYNLWKTGIHTVSSCCGHGRVPPYIQVLKGDSVKKMKELGYIKIENEVCNNENVVFRPKAYLPCFRSCSECENCVDDKKFFAKKCIAKDYDIDLKWCFKSKFSADWMPLPEPPKEEAYNA